MVDNLDEPVEVALMVSVFQLVGGFVKAWIWISVFAGSFLCCLPFSYAQTPKQTSKEGSPTTRRNFDAKKTPKESNFFEFDAEEERRREEDAKLEENSSSLDPTEKGSETYWFIGGFYRQLFMPAFIQEFFWDKAPSFSNPAFGVEVTMRKAGFNIVGNVWWASYQVFGAYRDKGDPITDTEIIDSSLSNVFGSVSFMWTTEFSPYVALEYGVGIGLGAVFGSLRRSEAYPNEDPNAALSADGFATCDGPGNPPQFGEFCDPPPSGQYNFEIPNWGNGGPSPLIVPWFEIPRVALRIKPIKQLMLRAEAGVGLGLFFGFSAAYGI